MLPMNTLRLTRVPHPERAMSGPDQPSISGTALDVGEIGQLGWAQRVRLEVDGHEARVRRRGQAAFRQSLPLPLLRRVSRTARRRDDIKPFSYNTTKEIFPKGYYYYDSVAI